jgi:hypothetical protein
VAPDAKQSKYLQVDIGSPVLTLDEKQLGTVAERRGQHFKVKTSFLHRDYWLRTDCVRSSGSGQPVVLNVTQAQLENVKMADEPLKD